MQHRVARAWRATAATSFPSDAIQLPFEAAATAAGRGVGLGACSSAFLLQPEDSAPLHSPDVGTGFTQLLSSPAHHPTTQQQHPHYDHLRQQQQLQQHPHYDHLRQQQQQQKYPHHDHLRQQQQLN